MDILYPSQQIKSLINGLAAGVSGRTEGRGGEGCNNHSHPHHRTPVYRPHTINHNFASNIKTSISCYLLDSKMSNIDITLPSRVPEMSRYHTIGTGLKPFAIYILSSNTNTPSLPDLLKTTNSLCPRPDYVKAPPKTIFKNSLKEVINYHLTLSQFDPRYLLAVTTEDWRERGIQVVTLDDDELDCKPDLFRIKAEDSGILLVNLQIGNTDWFEAKENYSLPSPATAERDDKDDKDADTDTDDSKYYAPSTSLTGSP